MNLNRSEVCTRMRHIQTFSTNPNIQYYVIFYGMERVGLNMSLTCEFSLLDTVVEHVR